MTVDATDRVVLIVDDDAEDRMFTREALLTAAPGVDVREAEDGVAFLEYLQSTGPDRPFPDLVLLDLKMPRMDGFEVLEVIRADPELRHLPIVAVFTTANDPDFVRRTYADGANGFLGKPATHEELAAMMRVVVAYWFGATSLPPRGLGPRG